MLTSLIVMAGLVAAPRLARADPGKILLVTANIQSACLIRWDSNSRMDFGQVTPGVTLPSKTVQGLALCTRGTEFVLTVQGGVSDRAMTNDDQPEAKLGYALCTNESCSQPFEGRGIGQGSDAGVLFTIYGRINPVSLLKAPAGSYRDTVVVTIEAQ